MPIVVNHGDPTTLLKAATASRQRQDQRILDQREFSRENREDEQAFREQENARNRQQQVAIQESAEQARIDQEELGAEIKKQQMIDTYKMKDEYEKKQLDQKRSQYTHKRQLIEDAYNGGKGKINYPQMIKALEDLNSQFSPMVTNPNFADMKKMADEHPTMEINGNPVKMAIDPKTGQPDPHKTKMDWEKNEAVKFKYEQDKKKEINSKAIELLKEAMKSEITRLGTDDITGKPKPFDAAGYMEKNLPLYIAALGGDSGVNQGGVGKAGKDELMATALNTFRTGGQAGAEKYINSIPGLSNEDKIAMAQEILKSGAVQETPVADNVAASFDPPELTLPPKDASNSVEFRPEEIGEVKIPADLSKQRSKALQKITGINKKIEEAHAKHGGKGATPKYLMRALDEWEAKLKEVEYKIESL
ncbi:MAG: hypothetical protein ACYTFY_14655 [Planctomycetota bacterium]|jgi:hypothetical protein